MEKKTRLPWWTWVAPFVILHIGSELSLFLRIDQGVSLIYFPTALSVILINWWGPWRTLPAVFINATLSTYLWGVSRVYLWPVYAFSDVIFILLSWLLFAKLVKGKYWIPDVRNLIYYLLLGILIPVLVEILYLELTQIYFGDQQASQFATHFATNVLSDVTTNFGISLPILYYITPYVNQKKLLLTPVSIERILEPKRKVLEVLIIYSTIIILSATVNFYSFWYIYGLFPLYAALRFGFGPAILMNCIIFLLTYLVPFAFKKLSIGYLDVDISHVSIHIGTMLLYVFSAITGRVINDLRKVEKRLLRQNDELEQTNKELDRFVYSVSHDLSAPLKSILGLVNISRLTNNTDDQKTYIGKIEASVRKLEQFITEILDYSRNKRIQITPEQIQLKELCAEILENLHHMEGYHKIQFDLSGIESVNIKNDRTRLKIIFNNIITNAIRFQKKMPDHMPFIKISSWNENNSTKIVIADNGEGISPEVKPKIFDMFYRGHQNSQGSGLGLYIAKETIEKINGSISVESEYGKGTQFKIELRNLA